MYSDYEAPDSQLIVAKLESTFLTVSGGDDPIIIDDDD